MKCGVNERVCAYVYAHVRVAQIGYVQWLTDGVPWENLDTRIIFGTGSPASDSESTRAMSPHGLENGDMPPRAPGTRFMTLVCVRTESNGESSFKERPGSKNSKQHCEALVALFVKARDLTKSAMECFTVFRMLGCTHSTYVSHVAVFRGTFRAFCSTLPTQHSTFCQSSSFDKKCYECSVVTPLISWQLHH
jgi:hypothetical protein